MTDKSNKLVQATNILEMVLSGASDLTDEITKQNFERASYRRQETGQGSWANFILRFE